MHNITDIESQSNFNINICDRINLTNSLLIEKKLNFHLTSKQLSLINFNYVFLDNFLFKYNVKCCYI